MRLGNVVIVATEMVATTQWQHTRVCGADGGA